MALVDWPTLERPREKLVALGPSALSDAELLAIFLRTGVKGMPVMELARKLLIDFGGLSGLLRADYQQLTGTVGVGLAKYVQLKAALELTERYLQSGLQRGAVISDPNATRQYLKTRMKGYEREVFACMYLDNQHRLIRYEELFFGTIDGATVHPREVVKRALENNAAAVIFAHNHPSGIAEPSQADRRITERLKAALAMIDVRVLDHFIVGDESVLSFAERGIL
ncbi:MAG: DNA repair protein RadC [Pseudomonadales bacterium]|nr:DNA repair protein RadC [Pseudomonadales bacterium]